MIFVTSGPILFTFSLQNKNWCTAMLLGIHRPIWLTIEYLQIFFPIGVRMT